MLRAAGGIFIALMLAACVGGNSPFGNSAPGAPNIAMAGRWMLTAPNAPACGMNFGGAPSAREGTVSPEGGCPGKFFMSRRWTLTEDTLAINDEENHPLGQLKLAGGRFEGQAVAGFPVTLAPPPAPAN